MQTTTQASGADIQRCLVMADYVGIRKKGAIKVI